MGNYRNAVITTQGLAYITQAIAGEITLTFSHMAISDYAYPAGTNLSALTSLTSVKMTVEPASVWVHGNTAGVRGLFSNAPVTVAYNIETVGVYATDGTTEILFSVSTATTPDEMPAYNGVAPSSFIFTVQETISEAASISINVTTTGTATAADIADLQASKQDVITGAASTVVSANLTGERALVSSATGKIVVSSATAQDLWRLHGVTSPVQTQLDAKQDIITGAASSIVKNDFPPGRVLISSVSGKVYTDENTVTSTELNYLSGCIGNVQGQIESLKSGKAIKNHASTTQDYGIATQQAYGHTLLRDNLTATDYTSGEALSGRQGAVLKGLIDAQKTTLPNIATVGVGDTTIASGTATAAGTISLTPGLWLIKVTGRWNANGNGVRQIWLSNTSTGNAKDFDSIVSYPAATGAITSVQLVVFASVSANTEFYIVAQQNSGAGVTLNTRYSLARLGD